MDLAIALNCPNCGYDLRASAQGLCPECGQLFNREKLQQSQIPWQYRHTIGYIRAYFKTAWWVMLHPALLADEIHKPADYRAAQHFRWNTAAIVFVLMLILSGYFCVFQTTVWPGSFGSILAVIVSLLTATLFTGLQSYLYHPRKLPIVTQNRAIALSYYTCAPLITIFLLGPFALIWLLFCNFKLLRVIDAGFLRTLMLPILWLVAVVTTTLTLAVVVYLGVIILSW